MRTKKRGSVMYGLVKRNGQKRWIALDEITENERFKHRYRHGKPPTHRQGVKP